jgi:SAM-dependent methyltransferase
MQHRVRALGQLSRVLTLASGAMLACEPAGQPHDPAPEAQPTDERIPLPPPPASDSSGRGPDFPTHHVADMIEQAVVDYLEDGDAEALRRATAWAEELANSAAPQYRFAHQLHAYTQRLAHGPRHEGQVLDRLPPEEQAAYRYFFDQPQAEVAAAMRCNLVASCTWRAGFPGFRPPGGAPLERVGAGEQSADAPSGLVRCGDRTVDPDTCPATFPVFERSSWMELGRDRLDLWSSEQSPLTTDVLVATLGIEPGDRVADVGAGSGWFSFPFARAVGPQGELLAVELDPAFADYLQAVAQGSDLTQVRVVRSASSTPELPAGELDLVWVSVVYQDLYLEDALADRDPHRGATMAFTQALASGLKPGGTLAVLELGPRSNGTGAGIETGFELPHLWALIEGAGLQHRAQVPAVVHAELHLFTKPGGP